MSADYEDEMLATPSKSDIPLVRFVENTSNKLRVLEKRINELEAKMILLTASEDEVI